MASSNIFFIQMCTLMVQACCFHIGVSNVLQKRQEFVDILYWKNKSKANIYQKLVFTHDKIF